MLKPRCVRNHQKERRYSWGAGRDEQFASKNLLCNSSWLSPQQTFIRAQQTVALGEVQPNTCCKWSFPGAQHCPFIYILLMAACVALQKQSRGAVTEILWLAKLKMFPIYPFTENFCSNVWGLVTIFILSQWIGLLVGGSVILEELCN